MNTQNYPGVFLRVKAVVIDSVILILLMLGAVDLFDSFNNVPDFARIAAFVFIFPVVRSAFYQCLWWYHWSFSFRNTGKTCQQPGEKYSFSAGCSPLPDKSFAGLAIVDHCNRQ